jgi:hypothetical protein
MNPEELEFQFTERSEVIPDEWYDVVEEHYTEAIQKAAKEMQEEND